MRRNLRDTPPDLSTDTFFVEFTPKWSDFGVIFRENHDFSKLNANLTTMFGTLLVQPVFYQEQPVVFAEKFDFSTYQPLKITPFWVIWVNLGKF